MKNSLIDSGIEWLGMIPNEWKTSRLQEFLYEIKESNNPIQTENILSLTNKLGVVPYSEKGNQGNTAKLNFEDYKIAYPGTIVANSMNILIGSVSYCDYYGCVSPVYYVFKNKNNSNLKFINYIMQTRQFQKELRKYANGILEIRLRVSSSDILKREIAMPNLDMQNKIVEYLNEKCEKIDNIIDGISVQIDELKKYRLSYITKCVTQGIEQNVQTKNINENGIEKLPLSWQKQKIKNIISMPVIDGPHISPELFDEGVPFISADAIVDGRIDFNRKRGFISREFSDLCRKRYSPRKNDILVVKLGASTGKIGIVGDETDFDIWVPLAVVRCNNEFDSKFVYYSLQSEYFQKEIKNGWTFGTQETLGVKTLEQLIIYYPSIEKQEQIVKHLDAKLKKIDLLLSIKQKKLEELNEYKKALIYEYVTGKKEVTA